MAIQGTVSSENQANVLGAEDLTAETAVADLDTVVGERADMRFFGRQIETDALDSHH